MVAPPVHGSIASAKVNLVTAKKESFFDKRAFKNYVNQRGWVGASPNVNCSNNPYLVKASTRGR